MTNLDNSNDKYTTRGKIRNRTKRWKLSPLDLQSRKKWVKYSKAKDAMFSHTDTGDELQPFGYPDVKRMSCSCCMIYINNNEPSNIIPVNKKR
jgi:hypothetical protein